MKKDMKDTAFIKEIEKHTRGYRADDSKAWKCVTISIALFLAPFIFYRWSTWMFIFLRMYSIVRVFMLFHDACHNSFWEKKSWNVWLGHITSCVGWIPYAHFRERHLYHHSIFGQEGIYDPGATTFLTAEKYHDLPFYLRWLYRILRDPFVFFFILAPIKMILWNPLRPTSYRYLPFIIAMEFFVIFKLNVALWAELTAFALASSAGVGLFHLQHVANRPYRVSKDEHSFKEAAIHGSTYVEIPALFKAMTVGIEYHHIHHLDTQVPCYLLQKCHEEAPQNFWNEVLFLDYAKSVRSLFHALYSEKKKLYESFDIYDVLLRAALPHVN